jgi:hypothetical protein
MHRFLCGPCRIKKKVGDQLFQIFMFIYIANNFVFNFMLLHCLVNVNLRKLVPYPCRYYCGAETDAELSVSVIDVGTSEKIYSQKSIYFMLKRLSNVSMYEARELESF